MKNATLKIFPFLLFPVSIFLCPPSFAQITPDTTLGAENSLVTPMLINGQQSDRIDGGAIRGTNLFHSFQEFNINAGRGAYFTNPDRVTNILTRVTGKHPSNINGTLGVLGNANLLFLNPNGIVFGPNASLNLNGSFLATSASSINFADGTSFSATTSQAAPLLTVNVPVGLGIVGHPGAIQVQGTGHSITLLDPILSPFIGAGRSLTGLRVQPGKTLALVGGDVALEGGTLTAPQGRIELGSVLDGQVRLSPTSQGWTLGYEQVQSFQDIRLSQKALVDASGLGGGDIQLVGKHVTLTDASIALIQNQGFRPAGSISVNASESLELIGTGSNKIRNSNLISETVGVGKAGDIAISTPRLNIQDGGVIANRTFSAAEGGNVTVNAKESVQVTGFSTINPVQRSAIAAVTYSSGRGGDVKVSTRRLSVLNRAFISSGTLGTGLGGDVTVDATESVEVNGFQPSLYLPSIASLITFDNSSAINSQTYGSGRAGDVKVSTGRLAVRDGGVVSSFTVGTGSGGDVFVNANDSVQVMGVIPITFQPSSLSASSFSAGKAGNLTINTSRLAIRDGGRVDASTFVSGNAGSVTINALESVDVSGTVPGSRNPSLVISSANVLDQALQRLYRLPPVPTGASGDVTINTKALRVTDGGLINVRNDGAGNAGTTTVNARSIVLDNQGGITAATTSGGGGNIFLQAQNLQLRHNSAITATAGGTGNGGNLTLDTGTLVALENSDISANAFRGRGGNILLDTQGVFRSANSDITASSQVGINGVVKFTNLDLYQQNALVAPESKVINAQQVVAGSCLDRRNAEHGVFVVTGNGGLPDNPYDAMTLPYELVLVQPVASRESADKSQQSRHSSLATAQVWKLGDPIHPATNLVVTADGRTLLVEANASQTVANPQDLTCQLHQPNSHAATK